ncbi:MAG: NADH dehydrogenase FAD-containing subunit, partial [Phycisphaerales bacterium]|nr:NADH dehydrogenase FAD-containing subunit [Phycisphaerales bacterium]
EGFLFDNTPEAVFTGCLLLFLAMMTLVTVSAHLGLLWVAVEATTLSSAPLIFYHRHHRSLEATWKYLLICSVGIALALMGNFALAAGFSEGTAISLHLEDLLTQASSLNPRWLQAAFILMLVGYGTKMGLAPMHTWLPDAHSEAPSVVSALLSGALLNCAFLAVLRILQVCAHAGCAAFGQELLLGFGLLSIALATIFIVGQLDYKRLLAYSSVEHVGILALGVGLGGIGSFGAMLHAVNHSLTKAMLFLLSGNILAVYRSKACGDVRGLARLLPATGLFWIAGLLAITGSPPFGVFLSEFTILKAAIDQGHAWVAVVFLVLLAIIFIAMSTSFLSMSQGVAPPVLANRTERDTVWSILPPAALGTAVLVLGIYIPPFVRELLEEAAHLMEGGS